MQLLKFYAEWCGPCKMMNAWLAKHECEIEIVDVDVDQNKELCQKYNIRGVPTLVLLNDDDTVRKTLVGFDPVKLEQMLQIQVVGS